MGKRPMTLTQLQYILAVAKYLHFGQAAESCSVSQPSLSVQIQRAEGELGARLFERNRTSCVITEVGRAVAEQARVILDEVKRLEDVVAHFQTGIKGTLKLGLIPTIAPFLLPSLLPHLRKAHPELRLELFEEKTSDLLGLLGRGEIDAAILSTPRAVPETLREKVLYYEPFVVFAAKGHPLRRCNPVTADDIKPHAALLLDDTHCLRDQVESICRAPSRATSSVQVKVGTLQTLVEVVNASGGYTLLPVLANSMVKASQRGALLEFEEPKPSRKVSLVFHRSFLKRPLIEALHALIQAHLPQGTIAPSEKIHAKIVELKKERFDRPVLSDHR